MLLFLPGGHFGLAPAVDDVDPVRAQAHGAAGAVHGHVAAAHYGYSFALNDRRIGLFGIGFHQIGPGQVLVGGVNALEPLAGDVHKHGQAGAGAHKHSLIAHFKQLVNGQHPADDHIGHHLDPLGLQLFDFIGDDCLGQTELGNAVHQDAAGGVQGFKNRDGIALLGQVRGAGETGRTGAHHGNLDSIGRCFFGHSVNVLPIPVGHEPLQTADGHRLALHAPDAFGLALALLGADPAGQSGQGVGGGDDFISCLKVAFGNLGDELGNADIDRAALYALGLLAAQAAAGFLHGLLGGVAQGYLFKIPGADLGVLLRHRRFGQSHICHCCFLLLKSGPCPWPPCGRRAPWPLGPPGPGKRRSCSSARHSPPDARQSRGRPHRRIWSLRPP